MKKTIPKQRRDWRPKFLEALRKTGNITHACKLAGIARMTAYEGRGLRDEPETEEQRAFRTAWDEAREIAADGLELEARRRAMTTSDVLLIFLLKALRPTIYRENVRLEHTGPDGRMPEITVIYENRKIDGSSDQTPPTA